MSNYWILQKKSFGLGNFIMATPAIRLLSERRKEKIKVFFETVPISQLYRQCPFVKILKKRPTKRPNFTIGRVRRGRTEGDNEAYCRALRVGSMSIVSTYVDSVQTEILAKQDGEKCVAVFHGCLGKCFRKKKDIGVETRQYILDTLVKNKIKVILLGAESDFKHYWTHNNLSSVENYLGRYSLQDSISLLSQCDNFISNDTGLYHVSGALKKEGLVLWKHTKYAKNKAPFKGIEHCLNSDFDLEIYKNAVDKYVKEVILCG